MKLVQVEAGSCGCWVVTVLVQGVIQITLGSNRASDRGSVNGCLLVLVQLYHLQYLLCE